MLQTTLRSGLLASGLSIFAAVASAATIVPIDDSSFTVTASTAPAPAHAFVASISDPTGPTGKAYKIDFYTGTSNQWYTVEFKFKAPRNLSTASYIMVDAMSVNANPGKYSFAALDATGAAISANQNALMRGTWTPQAIPITTVRSGADIGMFTTPDLPGGTTVLPAYATRVLNKGAVTSIKIYTKGSSIHHSLRFRDFRAVYVDDATRFVGSVDKYGQSTASDWANKVYNDSEIAADVAAEAADWAANPAPADRDVYGGWNSGPSLGTSASFRTAMYGGKWWLVDPLGKLFWSSAMGGVRSLKAGETMVTGRETMFNSLPAAGPGLGQFYGAETAGMPGFETGSTYDFSLANLYRKFGANYLNGWRNEVSNRLQSWGFNTIGNGSDVYGLSAPFTVGVQTPATVKQMPVYSLSVPDPYDPTFAAKLTTVLQPYADAYKNDPKLMGVYVDNELRWATGNGGEDLIIPQTLLTLTSSDSPAKTAFVNFLKQKYVTVAAFDVAWGANLTSWAQLDSAFTVPSRTNPLYRLDAYNFNLQLMRKYYSTVADTVHAAIPGKLYLGSRLHHVWIYSDVLKACAESADVVSINLYEVDLTGNAWKTLPNLNKPIIASEWHFGAGDQGLSSMGEIGAMKSSDRIAMAQNYLTMLSSRSEFVGASWFRYSDCPFSGDPCRGGGACVGLVSVADRPYEDLIDTFRSFNTSLYSNRG